MDLYPLTFTPRLVEKIWGGRKLETLLGKGASPAKPEGRGRVGESWELCDRPEFDSPVAEGGLKGMTLHQVLQEFGPHLVGDDGYRKMGSQDRFPLLVKFIDASDDLSVQVHPDDEYAALRIRPSENGKTEIWQVLEADGGAQVVAGVKPGTTREEFSRALREGGLESCLNRFGVKAGDAVFLPAGRIHALGKGCLVAEIQQNSDTTYRVWDYGRLENGKPRALHVQQALECIRFDAGLAREPGILPQQILRSDDYDHCTLASCPYFTVSRVWPKPAFSPSNPRASFHILVGVKGKGTVEWQGGSLEMSLGATVLVPASVEWRVKRTVGDFEVLWARK
jgi:mannose-6-phosphate isomerase